MVLCNRCKRETREVPRKTRPCVKLNGRPCLLCQEDMDLEGKIQELQDRRRNLQTQMNASHDPFILTFHPEISSHILLLSMQEWDYDPFHGLTYWLHDQIPQRLPTPFLLSSICRGWRQLARSTPRLWTTLSFNLAKPTKVPLFEAVRDWLVLSGGLSLNIWICGYKGENPVSQEMYGPVIDALNQHSGRWQKLFLFMPAPFLRHFHGSSAPSILYDLYVNNCPVREVDGSLPTFRMNFKPSPTNLTICNIRLSVNDIGWDNLTSLSMEGMAFNECIMAIRHAPLLESCTMGEIASDQGDLSIPGTKLRHPRLRTLDLRFVREDLFIDLLHLMECPTLEVFRSESRLSHVMVDSLLSFLNHSVSRLKALELLAQDQDGLDVEGLKNLLNAVPCLQRLSLEWTMYDAEDPDDLLQELSSSPPILAVGTPGFLPHLQPLTLSLCHISKWEYIPRIYTWPHRKLLSIEISAYETAIDDDTHIKISQLIDQGANIRILADGKDYFSYSRAHVDKRLLEA
ncbi:hypothetical protein M413DRAFT_246699 [Hebeloma cylindrosporum]|uniref:F-box domain-containing protein n=1 Tax=Hebeloma cylindrosporum TaxID=76867 RepID=A0A0C2XK70_HEBCY|nr:hypothetical protein M413DRAFT_246699 [Hebeloma cylindrosporum h7]